MLSLRSLAAALILIGSAVSAATPPAELSFDQLMTNRDAMQGKRVSVVGYFDVGERALFPSAASRENPVAIDLTDIQIRALENKGLLQSHYVRVVGTFERIKDPKALGPINHAGDSRIAVVVPSGFRGAYRARIADVTELVPVYHPKHLTRRCGESLLVPKLYSP